MTAESLKTALGGQVPPGIGALDEDLQVRIASLLEGARINQARALDDAIEGGLSNIPRALRGVVRRALFR